MSGSWTCGVAHCTKERTTYRYYCNSHHHLLERYGTVTPNNTCRVCGELYPNLGNGESHKFCCTRCLPLWQHFTPNQRHTCWAHGVSLANLLWLQREQAGKCAICGFAGKLEVDHDNTCCPHHRYSGVQQKCGKCVRGLLCHSCNKMLGYYEKRHGGLVVPQFDNYLAKGYIVFGELYEVG